MRHHWDNIILVGMPGSGKSTVASRLAGELGYTYLDGDRIIEEQQNKKLKEILAACGRDGFFRIESEALCGIRTHRAVIAPGGSVCYEPEAIEHLRSIGTVVFLSVDYEILRKRLGDLTARGVVLRPGMTLKDLYDERVPLYRACADIVLEEGEDPAWVTVRKLREQIKREERENGNDQS